MTTEQQTKPALILPAGGVRCWNCGKMVAWVVTVPYKLMCQHCKAVCEEK